MPAAPTMQVTPVASHLRLGTTLSNDAPNPIYPEFPNPRASHEHEFLPYRSILTKARNYEPFFFTFLLVFLPFIFSSCCLYLCFLNSLLFFFSFIREKEGGTEGICGISDCCLFFTLLCEMGVGYFGFWVTVTSVTLREGFVGYDKREKG